MLDSIDAESATLLREALDKESDADVREAMELGIAIGEISSKDTEIRLQAIDVLHGNLQPAAFNRLTSLVEKEQDEAVREAKGEDAADRIAGLKKAEIDIDRKMLADLAVHDSAAFSKLAEAAKSAL